MERIIINTEVEHQTVTAEIRKNVEKAVSIFDGNYRVSQSYHSESWSSVMVENMDCNYLTTAELSSVTEAVEYYHEKYENVFMVIETEDNKPVIEINISRTNRTF